MPRGRQQAPSSAEVIIHEEAQRLVVTAVQELREPLRTVIHLHYIEQQPVLEVSRLLETPVETVRTRVRKGLAELRTKLNGQMEQGTEGAWSLVFLALPFQDRPIPWQRITRESGLSMAALSPIALVTGIAVLSGVALLAWLAGRSPEQSERQTAPHGEEVAAVDRNVDPGPGLDPLPAPGPMSIESREPLESDATPVIEPPPEPMGQPDGAAPSIEVQVRVEDENGVPIGGAKIRVGADERKVVFETRAATDSRGSALVPLERDDFRGNQLYGGEEVYAPLVAHVAEHITSKVHYLRWPNKGPVTLVVGGPDMTVKGRVLDLQGDPIEGARVFVGLAVRNYETIEDGDLRNDHRHVTLSGADGHYEVSSVRPGRYVLFGVKEGWVLAKEDIEGGVGDEIECTLHLDQGGVLRGRVLDEDGSPCAGARVQDEVGQTNEPFSPWVHTDEDGSFVLRGLPPGLRTVWAYGPPGTWAFYEHTVVSGVEVVHGFQLRRGQVVNVRVVDTTGEPVAGLHVSAFSRKPSEPWQRAQATDADGRVQLYGVPDGPVVARIDDLDSEYRFPIEVLHWARPDDAVREVVREERPEGPAEVSGTLTRHDGSLWGGDTCLRMTHDMGRAMSRYPMQGSTTGDFRLHGLIEGGYTLYVETPAGRFALMKLEVDYGDVLDLGTVATPPPGTLELDWRDWADATASALYRHRILQLFLGPVETLGQITIAEGMGSPPLATELLPGTYGLLLARGPDKLLERIVSVRSNHVTRMPAYPDAPCLVAIDFHAPDDDTAEELTVRHYSIEDTESYPAEMPTDEVANALADAAELLSEYTVLRSADGWFRTDVEVHLGQYAVVAETKSGLRAHSVFSLESQTSPAYVQRELR